MEMAEERKKMKERTDKKRPKSEDKPKSNTSTKSTIEIWTQRSKSIFESPWQVSNRLELFAFTPKKR